MKHNNQIIHNLPVKASLFILRKEKHFSILIHKESSDEITKTFYVNLHNFCVNNSNRVVQHWRISYVMDIIFRKCEFLYFIKKTKPMDLTTSPHFCLPTSFWNNSNDKTNTIAFKIHNTFLKKIIQLARQ